jgi:hypothetical protein
VTLWSLGEVTLTIVLFCTCSSRSKIAIGLHHHVSNDGKPCNETRTGFDHIGIAVPNRSDLDSWASWLDAQNVAHSGVQTPMIRSSTRFWYSAIPTISS